MKRVIVDYKKLNDEIMNLLVEKFPYGYDDDDTITFKNTLGEQIEAVEVRTDETIYLVKIGKRLQDAMRDFDEDFDLDLDVVEKDEDEFDSEKEISPESDLE